MASAERLLGRGSARQPDVLPPRLQEPSASSGSHRHAPRAVVPAGFKAARRRKTPQFLRDEQRRAPFVRRAESQVELNLIDDTAGHKLLSGVARLVYRHIAEGDRRQSPPSPAPSPLNSVVTAGSGSHQHPELCSEDFNVEHYFLPARRPWCPWLSRMATLPALRRPCCCCRRRPMALADEIFAFLHACTTAGWSSQELIVVATVYIERFRNFSDICLTVSNWRSILLAALQLASKVWEDIHPWNVDFAAFIRAATGLRVKDALSLYKLEKRFLRALDWQACVTGEVYAAYFFSLRDADTGSPVHRQSLDPAIRRSSSWCAMDSLLLGHMVTIDESPEELHFASRATATTNSPGRPGDSIRTIYNSVTSSTTSWPAGVGSSGGGMRRSRSLNSLQGVQAEDLLRTDPRNPLVGSFRHAPYADPPSRHINSRGSSSSSSVNPAPRPATFPVEDRAIEWQRAVSA